MSDWRVEFLNDAVEEEFDRFPAEIQAKVIHVTQLIEEFGILHIRRPYIKHIQGKIWEIRASGKDKTGRCLYLTAQGKRVILLRCFTKKSQKTPKREIEIAHQRAKEIDNG